MDFLGNSTSSSSSSEDVTTWLFTYRDDPNHFEYVLRPIIVFSFIMVLGMERQHARKPIGFGVFTLVSAGSCALAMLAVIVQPASPIGLLGSTITGISFLGSGSLTKAADGTNQGMLTGSLLVAVCIFGLVLGTGLYIVGLVLYVSVVIIVLMDRFFQYIGFGSHRIRVSVTLCAAAPSRTATLSKEQLLMDEDDSGDHETEVVTMGSVQSSGDDPLIQGGGRGAARMQMDPDKVHGGGSVLIPHGVVEACLQEVASHVDLVSWTLDAKTGNVTQVYLMQYPPRGFDRIMLRLQHDVQPKGLSIVNVDISV